MTVKRTAKASPTAVVSNRDAVESLLGALRRAGPVSAHDEALGRVALTLADTLDRGAGVATAAVARELRIALANLTEHLGGDDDKGQHIFGSDLPAATVRHRPRS